MKKKNTYNYFDEFIKTSNHIVESSEILKETFENYNEKTLEDNIKKVHALENEADNELHTMRNYLIKDFLPPIDREDIIIMGHALDNVEDEIDELLINFNILNVTNIRKEVNEFTKLLIKCCNSVKSALQEFENFKKFKTVKEKIIELNFLEEEGDRLYENAMKTLYRENIDVLEIVKWTSIYRGFEDAIDACEKVADCMEDVMMKNS